MSDTRMRDIFTHYYETNFWRGHESVSGQGSDLDTTEVLREYLAVWLANSQVPIRSMLDISCGDFLWLSHVKEIKNIRYIGGDIVPELIRQNRERYVHPNLEFQVLDATTSRLPEVDLILCRDTLVHLTNREIDMALKNFRASGSTYLLATTFPGNANPNQDIPTGEWRPLDLERLRYGLGPAIWTFEEKSQKPASPFANKSLGLWRLNP